MAALCGALQAATGPNSTFRDDFASGVAVRLPPCKPNPRAGGNHCH